LTGLMQAKPTPLAVFTLTQQRCLHRAAEHPTARPVGQVDL